MAERGPGIRWKFWGKDTPDPSGAQVVETKPGKRKLLDRFGRRIIPPARWAEPQELNEYFISEDPTDRPHQIALGWVDEFDVNTGIGTSHLIAGKPSHSLLALGSTEAGKTMSLVIPPVLEWGMEKPNAKIDPDEQGGAVVVSGTQRDVIDWTHDARKRIGEKNGKKVYVFDPSGSLGEEYRGIRYELHGFSFLEYCKTISSASETADMIINTSDTGRSDQGAYKKYWESLAGLLLTSTLHAVAIAEDRHMEKKGVTTKMNLLRKLVAEMDVAMPIEIYSENLAQIIGGITAYQEYLKKRDAVSIDDLENEWRSQQEIAHATTANLESQMEIITMIRESTKGQILSDRSSLLYNAVDSTEDLYNIQSYGLQADHTKMTGAFDAIRAVRGLQEQDESVEGAAETIREQIGKERARLRELQFTEGQLSILDTWTDYLDELVIEKLADTVDADFERDEQIRTANKKPTVIDYTDDEDTVRNLFDEEVEDQYAFDFAELRFQQSRGKKAIVEELRDLLQEDNSETLIRQRRRELREKFKQLNKSTRAPETRTTIEDLGILEGLLMGYEYYLNNADQPLEVIESQIQDRNSVIEAQIEIVNPTVDMLLNIRRRGKDGVVEGLKEHEHILQEQIRDTQLSEQAANGGLAVYRHIRKFISENGRPPTDAEVREKIGGMVDAKTEYEEGLIRLKANYEQMKVDTDDSVRQNDRKLEQITECFSMIDSFLKPYNRKSALASAQNPDIKPQEILANGDTLYIHLPAGQEADFKPIINLMLSMFLREAEKQKNTSKTDVNKIKPALFALDELGSFGKIDVLPRLVAVMRHLRLRTIMVFQDAGQIKNLYKDEYGSIINNTRAKVIFPSTDPATQKLASDLVGIGPRDVPTVHLKGNDQLVKDRSYQTELAAVMEPSALRRVEDETGILVLDNKRAALMRTRAAYDDETLRDNDPTKNGFYRDDAKDVLLIK